MYTFKYILLQSALWPNDLIKLWNTQECTSITKKYTLNTKNAPFNNDYIGGGFFFFFPWVKRQLCTKLLRLHVLNQVSELQCPCKAAVLNYTLLSKQYNVIAPKILSLLMYNSPFACKLCLQSRSSFEEITCMCGRFTWTLLMEETNRYLSKKKPLLYLDFT